MASWCFPWLASTLGAKDGRSVAAAGHLRRAPRCWPRPRQVTRADLEPGQGLAGGGDVAAARVEPNELIELVAGVLEPVGLDERPGRRAPSPRGRGRPGGGTAGWLTRPRPSCRARRPRRAGRPPRGSRRAGSWPTGRRTGSRRPGRWGRSPSWCRASRRPRWATPTCTLPRTRPPIACLTVVPGMSETSSARASAAATEERGRGEGREDEARTIARARRSHPCETLTSWRGASAGPRISPSFRGCRRSGSAA